MKEMKNRTAEYNRIGQLPIDATFFFLHACVSHPIPTDLVFVGSFLFFSSSFFFLVVGLRCRRLRGYAYQGGRPMFEFMKREILLGRRRECRTVDRRPVAIFARGL